MMVTTLWFCADAAGVPKAAASARTCALAGVVTAVGILDLDNLGAHVREDLRAERSGDDAREIDDANSGERWTARL